MTITETLVACIFCFIIGILMVGGMIKIGEIIIDCYNKHKTTKANLCLLYTSPSPRDKRQSRMPSSA